MEKIWCWFLVLVIVTLLVSSASDEMGEGKLNNEFFIAVGFLVVGILILTYFLYSFFMRPKNKWEK